MMHHARRAVEGNREMLGLSVRVTAENDQQVNAQGRYVLYWMTAQRRLQDNFALDQAVHWAVTLGKPLLLFEALRVNYRWANDRLHTFVLQGMSERQKKLDNLAVDYFPYVEPEQHKAEGLITALAGSACVVVTDDFPCFFLPALLRKAARMLQVRLEKVDSAGLLPMRSADKVYPRAFDFRRYLQRYLPDHLGDFPQAEPLNHPKLKKQSCLPIEIAKHWQPVPAELLNNIPAWVSRIPIDHSVPPGLAVGGESAALDVLSTFLNCRLPLYGTQRSEPETEAASGLSPYLHFGNISAHRVFKDLCELEGWNLSKLGKSTSGGREKWWGMSGNAESFLDELVTWRELGYSFCCQRSDFHRYDSLPDWAKDTLAVHARDLRPAVYTLEEFEKAETHDPLWNAAQNQLTREGRMHNYLRMLWGKKILEWSSSPQEALRIMIELNNKYALDGRNPNSYSGIMWVLGRYDRPWGPERPIFGKIRYMSSDNTAKKFSVSQYIQRYTHQSVRQQNLF